MTVSVDVLVGVVAEIVELAVFTGEPSLPDGFPEEEGKTIIIVVVMPDVVNTTLVVVETDVLVVSEALTPVPG